MNIDKIDPELRAAFKKIPTIRLDWRWVLWLAKRLTRRTRDLVPPDGVVTQDRSLGNYSVRVYSPERGGTGPCVLWIHGGGLVIGTLAMNDYECFQWVKELGVVVVSVEYRLAPEHPYPAAPDDCYAAWEWLQGEAQKLGVDPERIVVSGQSAGGCLAALLAQRIHDEGGAQPAGQALLCPMLDDRTAARAELDMVKHAVWNNQSNRAAWGHYLGHAPGEDDSRPYAVPARREDLSGLPEAWIGIGDADLFFEEALDYAERLRNAGTACEFHRAPGGFHGFEGIVRKAMITRDYYASNAAFLRRTLGIKP